MSNIVEIIERAIGRGATDNSVVPWTDKQRAHAVCAALYDAGFVIVPAKPTEGMVHAAMTNLDMDDEIGTYGVARIYEDMVGAA